MDVSFTSSVIMVSGEDPEIDPGLSLREDTEGCGGGTALG